ncbi:bifunctional YncE family protein/alkaline phosphatase family protein [Bryobacter aggregatus]|uniref:bifunctional YncE family protein/alkaline phosphatase family protein n=1 Tax=Bryobacter aggregatus TaxID=360054 RepID=UPI0004E1D4CF|nr:alkaline phosphatase family protein [Bryobacter aggregatus]
MPIRPALLAVATCLLQAGDFRTPAGTETAARRPGALTVLPGGRYLTPFGQLQSSGPGSFGIAVNPKGDAVVSADGGPTRFSLTVLKRDSNSWRSKTIRGRKPDAEDDDPDGFPSVFQGLAFETDSGLFFSEGNSGSIRRIDIDSGRTLYKLELNQGDFRDSYSGDLAYDAKRKLLYVVDQANFRIGIFDTDKRRLLQSVRVGRLPFALALSPDQTRLYVTNLGIFESKPIERAPFPVAQSTLGNPNEDEANSLAVLDIASPGQAKLLKFIRTGLSIGDLIIGGSSPSGVVATHDQVYVANAHNDSISVIDARKLETVATIPIHIPKLEGLRGVLPIGLAWHAGSRRLLVAEAGINAIGVIDPQARRVLGHIPSAFFPTDIAVSGNRIHVATAKGLGTGPNATSTVAFERTAQADLRRGGIQTFELPGDAELAPLTQTVLKNNGFLESNQDPAPLPAGVKHVVLIVKENRSFDELFGDLEKAGNGDIRGAWLLARFGRYGIVQVERSALKPRISQKGQVVSPNHIALAQRFSISDNFYADSETSVDGHHWLAGAYPNAWTESSLMAAFGGQKDFRLPTNAPGRLQFPGTNASIHAEELIEAGSLWHHLARHKISFRSFGEGFELAGADEGMGMKPTGARFRTNVSMPDILFHNTSRNYPLYNMYIPDQYRASQFIAESKEGLPQFTFIHLPNDHTARPRREEGYPVEASYMADNDLALGRIIEHLSHTKEWESMAIFVTEATTQGGVDHIDSHRAPVMVLGPYAKQNYVSRVNTSFPGLLKTIYRLLQIPSLHLLDHTAQDLADCFALSPDLTPFQAVPANLEIFDPARAREPRDPITQP